MSTDSDYSPVTSDRDWVDELASGPEAWSIKQQIGLDVAAAESRGRAAGWREAIEALRTGEAWKAAQQALADEWHEDDCHCDAWPEDCRTHPRNTWSSGRDFAPSSWHPETVAPYFADFLESLAPKETP